MELRQLRYFIAVAEDLHFRRAAARLHMSQPPLSHQIRLLEDELGCTLLARSRRHVELTPAGESFLRDADAVLQRLEHAAARARRIGAGQAGHLRVSFVGSALLSLVPRVVQAFRAAHPDVELELHERSTEEQLSALKAGDIEIGLMPLPIDARGVQIEVLLRERTIAALPADHPLAARKRVTMRQLAAHPLVLFPRSQAPGLHDALLASLGAAGTPPVVAQYAPETQTIIGLVAAGTGVSLVQASVKRLALPGVTYRPVVAGPLVELAAVVRPGEPSPTVHAFLELARSQRPPPAPENTRKVTT